MVIFHSCVSLPEGIPKKDRTTQVPDLAFFPTLGLQLAVVQTTVSSSPGSALLPVWTKTILLSF
jgi:hypothetical protein